MRQTAKQAKVYQAPTIKVVQFTIERGFILSGEDGQDQQGRSIIEDFKSIEPNSKNNQYSQANDWGTFTEQ